MMRILATSLGVAVAAQQLASAAAGADPVEAPRASHNYTRHPGVQPSSGAFQARERITVEQCMTACDTLDTKCAGFSQLVTPDGTGLCAFYSSAAGLAPSSIKDLVAFWGKGAPGPHPSPGPPPPPPLPPAPPPSPPPRAPDNFLCTFETDVGKGEPITLNVTRSAAPIGVDHFYMLASIGFYNNSAFFRYFDRLVQWGISGNQTLNFWYGHTGIPDDPLVMSNTIGTVSFANHGVPNSRATEIFVNFQDNSHLDSEGFVPFATVVGAKGLATAVAIHNPTPNNTGGVDQQSYADKGNDWIRQTYPGINFIKGVTLSA